MSMPVLSILAAGASASDSPPAWITFAPIALVVVVMYFLVFRPQVQQQKTHKAKLEGIKKGDQVLTGGGLIAKVIGVDGEYCTIEIAPGVKARALKSTIADVIPPGGAPAAND